MGKKLNIEEIRKLFPVTETKVYLNHASTGPITTRARKAIEELLDVYEKEVDITKEFLDDIEDEVRRLAARLVGVQVDEIGLVKNTSQGIIIPMNALDWEQGANVILRTGGFPANVCPWIQNLPHVEKRFIEAETCDEFIDACASKVSAATKIIAVDWVDFLSGQRMDLARLGAFCAEHGILLFVDGIQGLGALHINLSKLPVDVFSCGAAKWLFGPQGIGIMYIRKKLLGRLNLKNTGWLSVGWQDFQHFEVIPPMKQSAARYEEGTRNLIGMVGMREHLKLFLEIGPDSIEGRIEKLREMIVTGLTERGCTFLSPINFQSASGMVTFSHPKIQSERLYESLLERNIIVSIREDWIRVSPHFYNTEAEIEEFLKYVP
jgi:selenocysteine lyase/cysteine desulfurase